MAESRSCLHRTDPLTDLLYLEQTGNVQEFYNSFNLLQSGVIISEDLVLEVFLRGLKPEIEKFVRLFNPRILNDAYSWARLKELTIPVSGVKENVLLDEIGAENGLKSVLEGSENVVASEVFDEMSVKDSASVIDAEILLERESVFQDIESQDEDLCLGKLALEPLIVKRDYSFICPSFSKASNIIPVGCGVLWLGAAEEELGGSCLGFLFQHDSLRNGGSSVNVNRIMEALTAYPDEEIKGDDDDCDLRNLYHSPNAQLKEGNQLAKGWYKYPSLHKGNLRLGVSST